MGVVLGQYVKKLQLLYHIFSVPDRVNDTYFVLLLFAGTGKYKVAVK